MSKLVSIIMPVYNVENYIDEAVRSLLNQTYKSLEIIIVDDYSTDNTYKKLIEWQYRDSRIKLYRNRENLKIVKTLNFALSKVTGQYIGRMDGDDVSTPDRIEKLVGYLNHDLQCGLVGSNFTVIDALGKELRKHKLPGKILLNEIIMKGMPVAHIWVARKEVYDLIGDYRVDTAEDYDFLLRMYSMGLKFDNVNEYLYKVRARTGNTASTQGLKQIKATEYARILYKQRMEEGFDNYSEESFAKYCTVNKTTERIHLIAEKLFLSGGQSQSQIKRYLFTAVASSLSPYVLKKIYSRYTVIKRIKKHR